VFKFEKHIEMKCNRYRLNTIEITFQKDKRKKQSIQIKTLRLLKLSVEWRLYVLSGSLQTWSRL